MPNLITLVCPSCGGKLSVSPSALTMTCQFCGNEHLVKHETGGAISLEAYARCPVCGRNDKAEKVSAILVSQSQEISGTEQKQELVGPPGQQRLVVREVPFTRRQISVLGQRLLPPNPPDPASFPPFPPPPVYPNRMSRGGATTMVVLGGIIAGLALLGGICSGGTLILTVFDPSAQGAAEVGSLGIAGLLGSALVGLLGLGLLLAGFLNRRKPENSPDPRQAIERQYRERLNAVQREHERIRQEYARAMERYEKLYYCSRDDCVFIPGETTSAALGKMGEYLYAHPPELPRE